LRPLQRERGDRPARAGNNVLTPRRREAAGDNPADAAKTKSFKSNRSSQSVSVNKKSGRCCGGRVLFR
jgi:hypothetical protein